MLQSADDFPVGYAAEIEQVVALGSFSLDGPLGPVTVEFYAGDGPGGLPGTLVCSEVGVDNYGTGPVMDLGVQRGCVLQPGTYWVSVYPVMSFTDFGQWFWSSNGSGYGSEFAFRDPDGLVGNPCTDWGLGQTDCGVGTTYPNLCFGIGEIRGDGDMPGVPAVGTAGSVVLLLVLLTVSAYLLKQRQ